MPEGFSGILFREEKMEIEDRILVYFMLQLIKGGCTPDRSSVLLARVLPRDAPNLVEYAKDPDTWEKLNPIAMKIMNTYKLAEREGLFSFIEEEMRERNERIENEILRR